MKKNIFLKRKFLLNFLIVFLFFYFSKDIFSAYFVFDPTDISVSKNQTFQLQININPENQNIKSADLYISYPSDFLKITSISSGTIFPVISNDYSNQGSAYIAGMMDSPNSYTSSSGKLATITFQAIKDGNPSVIINCNSSKIIKADISNTNLINCSLNNKLMVNIGSSANLSSNNDPLENVEKLPKTGVLENIIKFGVPGLIFVVFGIILRFFNFKF
ncbi:MAG: cohesin domain-containing protein [Patescibacteria group bacterium]|nr:cohesin domain-containing protein [Patescibacteria group bacterium]